MFLHVAFSPRFTILLPSQVFKNQRYRFRLVVEELASAEVMDYQATLLAFVNCIVLGVGSLQGRVAIRNEFIGGYLTGLFLKARVALSELIILSGASLSFLMHLCVGMHAYLRTSLSIIFSSL